MIEYCFVAGLIGLGIIMNKNGKQDRKSKTEINGKYNLNNVYNSNISNQAMQFEKELVEKKYNESKNPDTTNIIPNNYNQKIINEPKVEKPDVIVSKLSGAPINRQNFTHNNMVPFFGSNIKQNMSDNSNSTIMEKFTGNGDGYQNKKEVTRMFKLEKKMSNVNGFKNNLDNDILRYDAGKIRNNELPIEQIKVGPGINNKYGESGVGGFHQLDVQELMRPKTVDEVRTVNNPKLTFKGRIIAGKKEIKRAMDINLQKNRPETFYKNSPDRYFKTTGAVIRPKLREKCYAKPTRKQKQRAYAGGAGPAVNKKPVKIGLYRKSHKNNYLTDGPRNIGAGGKWDNQKDNADYGKKSINLPSNERESTQKRTHLSNLVSAFKSLTAPISDIVKTTRKENFIGNPRPSGNVSMPIPEKITAYDPNDVARTTIKETQIHNERSGAVGGHTKLQTYDPNDVARTTIKETQIDNERSGNVGGHTKLQAHDPNDVSRTTIKETNIHNERDGNLSGPSKLQAHDPNDVTRTTIKETTINNERDGNIAGPEKITVYDPNDVARTTIKETNIHNDRDGNLAGPQKLMVYDPNDVARTTIKETIIHDNRLGLLSSKNNIKGQNYEFDDAPKVTIRNTLEQLDNNINISPRAPEKHKVHDPNDTARTTTKETTLYSDNGNIERQREDGYLIDPAVAPNTNRQFTSDYEYTGNPDGDVLRGGGDGYQTANITAPNTIRQFTTDYEYSGHADSINTKPISYDDKYNASLNINKEEISLGRDPTKESVKLNVGEDLINMEIRKLEQDIINTRELHQERLYTNTTTLESCSLTTPKITLPNDINTTRIEPDILDTFKNNPYTQSLNSFGLN